MKNPMRRFGQFFEDDEGYFSMARLIAFGSFVFSSWAIIVMAYNQTLEGISLGAYVTAWAALFGYCKRTDKKFPSQPPVKEEPSA